MHLDLSIWMLDKESISNINKIFLALDCRVKPFVKAVRHWSKRRDLNNAYHGTINSFGWTMTSFAYRKGLFDI